MFSASYARVWALWGSLEKNLLHYGFGLVPPLYLGTKWGVRIRQPALGPRTPYLKLRRMAEAMTRAEKESA